MVNHCLKEDHSILTISLHSVVRAIFDVYYILIIVRVLMSWVQAADNLFTRFIYEVTEPVLGLFRRIFPPRPGFPLDIAPIFAFIALQLVERLLLSFL
ncbi:MAG: YggT family protein [Clostridiales bacterium]|nr:YggT family protein [Clostridiales bacterium]